MIITASLLPILPNGVKTNKKARKHWVLFFATKSGDSQSSITPPPENQTPPLASKTTCMYMYTNNQILKS